MKTAAGPDTRTNASGPGDQSLAPVALTRTRAFSCEKCRPSVGFVCHECVKEGKVWDISETAMSGMPTSNASTKPRAAVVTGVSDRQRIPTNAQPGPGGREFPQQHQHYRRVKPKLGEDGTQSVPMIRPNPNARHEYSPARPARPLHRSQDVNTTGPVPHRARQQDAKRHRVPRRRTTSGKGRRGRGGSDTESQHSRARAGLVDEKLIDSRAFLAAFQADEEHRHRLHAMTNGPGGRSIVLGPLATRRERCTVAVDGRVANTLVAILVLGACGLAVYELFTADRSSAFRTANAVFFAVFAVELVVRILSYQCGNFLSRPLCIIDAIVVATDIAALAAGAPRGHAFRLLRVLRIARFWKPTRMSRIGPEPAGLETEKYVVDNGHIIGYNATHVMSRGWAWPRAGSVAFSLDLWSQGIVLCVLCGVWAARMCPSQCTKNPGIFDANDVVCHRCAQPIGPLPAVILGIFTAVIVGILLTRTLSRWSAMHSHFASIVSNVRDLSQRLTAHMSGPTPEEQAVRNRLHRLQLAALVLLTQRLRNERDLEALERRKLLRYRERARLGSAGGAHSVVYSWMCGVLAEYSRIPNTPFSRCPGAVGHANGMEQSIGRQQRHADALESLLDTQDPFAFVHLAAVTVKLTLVVVALWAAEYVRLGHDNESYSALTFGFLLVLVINFAAEGTLQVHAALHRPFGYRAGDMAQHMYIRSAVSLCTDTFDRDWASVSRGRVDSKLSAQKRRDGAAVDRADHKERTGGTRVAEARSQSRRRRENERSAADMPTTEPRGGQYGSHKSAKSTKSAKSHRSAKVMHPWA